MGTSTLLRLVMVLVTLLDLTLLLFLMAVPSMSTTMLTDMKGMLLMLPMMALLSTQISQLSMPHLSLAMLDKSEKGCGAKEQIVTRTELLQRCFLYLFVFIMMILE